MLIGRSGNPTLKDSTFENRGYGEDRYQNYMTINGTVNKAFITLIILLASAFATWMMFFDGKEVMPLAYGGLAVGFILALVISFKPVASPYLVPIYAVAEGMFLGALSATYESLYNGITLQAALLTMAVFVALLTAYKTRLIKATENFKLGVVAATGVIMYLLSFVLSFFGISIPYLHENSLIGIGISVVIVIIAALNLVLDFDFIEGGAEQGAPKYMEWYGAFGLMVTLVWLYIEIIRLLSKLRSRD